MPSSEESGLLGAGAGIRRLTSNTTILEVGLFRYSGYAGPLDDRSTDKFIEVLEYET